MRRVRWILAWVMLLLLVPALSASTTWNGYRVVNVLVNGKRVQGDVPAIIVDGRTMLPVRAITEALGAQVQWDEATSTVTITVPGGATPPTPVKAPPSSSKDAKVFSTVAVLGHNGMTVGISPQVTEDLDWQSVTLTQFPFKGAQRYVPLADGTVIGPFSLPSPYILRGIELQTMVDPWSSWGVGNELVLTVEASKSPAGPWQHVLDMKQPAAMSVSDMGLLPADLQGQSIYLRLTTEGISREWGYSMLRVGLGT